MKCPRCHVEVPAQATRCPDCKLQKPKSLIAPNGKQKSKASAKQNPMQTNRQGMKPERNLPKWASIAAGIVSGLLIVAIGIYAYWYFAHTTSELDPHLAQPAMQKLRQMPSQQANLTVDQYLN